jgi:amino-acid N-acetyltransferase
MTKPATRVDGVSPTVRTARAGDLPAVERLLSESGLPLAGVSESLATFVVAERAGNLVGVAGLEICGGNALLRSVAVEPAWRGRGVGRALVTRMIADAEARGLSALYLLTTTAERYFPEYGFVLVTRDAVPAEIRATDEFQTACPESATAMSRKLATAGRA